MNSFTSLIDQLRVRPQRATLGLFGPNNSDLRRFLEGRLIDGDGFLGQPVFEALHEWERHAETVDQLSYLHPNLKLALDSLKAPEPLRFPRDRRPYTHQHQAWRTLSASGIPRSVLISTGTSSGKTECFLVPILNDLAREQAEQGGRLTGVRALFLYPLNALINSQKERLDAWTRHFNGNVRYCLYNGATPNSAQGRSVDLNEVADRKTLRVDPPPMLITNATMLEFMLTRAIDAPIIDQSQGKLRWIVLDEAHTYLGSAAAEIALLLRRVMHAFGAESGQVRFVATSATIGQEGQSDKLRRYLADLAGVPIDQVDVVSGRRVMPPLPEITRAKERTLDDAMKSVADETDAIARGNILASVPAIRGLVSKLLKPTQLKDIAASLRLGETAALKTLDACTTAMLKHGEETPWLLPLRAHLFTRTLAGLWSCVNPKCSGRSTHGPGGSWPFGRVFLRRMEKCESCESLVFPVVLCRQCGEAALSAGDNNHQLTPREFSGGEDRDEAEQTQEEAFDAAPEEEYDAAVSTASSRVQPTLLCRRHRDGDGTVSETIDPRTGDKVAEGAAVWTATPEGALFTCPCCGERGSRDIQLFCPMRAGAPFYLNVALPELLEAQGRPVVGSPDRRRLITFTDSRQGTARSALRTENEANRQFVRSFVYHSLCNASNKPNVHSTEKKHLLEKRAEAARLIEQLRANPAAAALDSIIKTQEATVADCESRLEKLDATAFTSVPWESIVTDLADRPEIGRYWRLLSYRGVGDPGPTGPKDVARLLLMREFFRRPKRQNSLESLGFVALHYPSLDAVLPPSEWKPKSGDRVKLWQDFLRFCLDFFIRNRGGWSVPRWYPKWLGIFVRPHGLVEPGGHTEVSRPIYWPSPFSAGRPLPVVRVLTAMIGANPDETGDRELIADLMLRSWNTLAGVGLLRRGEDDLYRLHIEDVALRLVTDAFVCPTIGRIIAEPPAGLSPYAAPGMPLRPCSPIRMPRLAADLVFPASEERFLLARQWVECDPDVMSARQQGVWTDVSDRIVEFPPYFSAEEHSAQRTSEELQRIEKEFKDEDKGRLNVLSCSTTMEMGVDIGALVAVAMNNAPPGPANYLQRGGRAGRRGQSRAVALTLCQSVPHGEAVFANTTWPFTTPVHVPQVSLSSGRIVRRHIWALILGHFLRGHVSDARSTEAGWFFMTSPAEKEVAPGDSVCNQFIDWLTVAAGQDAALAGGVRRLTDGTALSGIDPTRLAIRYAEETASVRDAWLYERQGLEEQFDTVGGRPGDWKSATAPQRAVLRQIRRLEGEYLLSTLADRGLLPSHGMPHNVLPFVNTTLVDLKKQRPPEDGGGSEDRRGRQGFPDYPSRPLPVALREYAPGNTVVAGGRVFESAGLTLHWKRPPGDTVDADTQAIGHAWRCRDCGASGQSPARPDDVCDRPGCGGSREIRRYLQPSGFAVDFYQDPLFTEDSNRFRPPAPPAWINIEGDRRALADPNLGWMRHDSAGTLFHYSPGGLAGFGYAVCLQCGRAAPETDWQRPGNSAPVHDNTGTHRRLRGGKEGDTPICTGKQHAIQRNLWLGGTERTDVFELFLRAPASPRADAGESAATSLAVALRQALASRLGIDPREIGYTARRVHDHGQAGNSIVLYDTAAGGAGYVARCCDDLGGLLENARKVLNCPRQCDRACHACLLGYDTQRVTELLDRHEALSMLPVDCAAAVRLPEKLQVFGPQTTFEVRPVREALVRALRHGASNLRVWMTPPATQWEIDSWPLRSLLQRAAADHVKIDIAVTSVPATAETRDLMRPVALWAKAVGVTISDGTTAAVSDTVDRLFEVTTDGACAVWAIYGKATRTPGAAWGGTPAPAPLICGPVIGWKSLSNIDPSDFELLPPAPGHARLDLTSQFDGPVHEFGKRFWAALSMVTDAEVKARLDSKMPVKSVRYADRYLKSPLTLRLLFEALQVLPGIGSSTDLQVYAWPVETGPWRSALSSNFHDPMVQTAVAQAVLRRIAPTATYNTHLGQKQPHYRRLDVIWADNKQMDVTLDQGFGLYRAIPVAGGDTQLASSAIAERQAEAIVRKKFRVQADNVGWSSCLFVSPIG